MTKSLWQQLMKTSDGIPKYDSLFGVILEVLNSGEVQATAEIYYWMIKIIKPPQDIVEARYPKSNDLILKNRMTFTLSELQLAGMLDKPRRGQYCVTNLGGQILHSL